MVTLLVSLSIEKIFVNLTILNEKKNTGYEIVIFIEQPVEQYF